MWFRTRRLRGIKMEIGSFILTALKPPDVRFQAPPSHPIPATAYSSAVDVLTDRLPARPLIDTWTHSPTTTWANASDSIAVDPGFSTSAGEPSADRGLSGRPP